MPIYSVPPKNSGRLLYVSIFTCLLLNVTGLFRFLAPVLSVNVGAITVALLAVQSLYLLVRYRAALLVMFRTDVKVWLVLILMWPVATTLYANTISGRDIGLQVYYFVLIWTAATYTMDYGVGAMRDLLNWSIVIGLLGFIGSMLLPELFAVVALMVEAEVSYQGRAYGFYMQPNAAAMAAVFIFMGWYLSWNRKHTLWDVFAFLVFVSAILLTGSRTGAIISLIIFFLVFLHYWLRHISNSYAFFLFYKKIAVLVGLFGVALVALNVFLAAVDVKPGSLADRVSMMTQLKISRSNVSQTGSVRERLDAQMVYWSLITERPVLGHGLGAEGYYVEKGDIKLTSHSTFLAAAVEFGFIYPLVILLVLAQMWLKPGRVQIERIYGVNSILQMIVVSMLLFLVNGGLLSNRPYYIILGMCVALIGKTGCTTFGSLRGRQLCGSEVGAAGVR